MHHNTVCYLESLPIELLQEIIGLLLKSSPNPSSSANDEEWHHNDSESDMHDSLNTFTPAVGLDSAWTIPLRNAGNVLATFTGDTAQTRAFVSSSSSPLAGTDVSLSPIKALRR